LLTENNERLNVAGWCCTNLTPTLMIADPLSLVLSDPSAVVMNMARHVDMNPVRYSLA